MTHKSYLQVLQEKIIVFDGAMGTNLQLLNLRAEHFGGEQTFGCNDFLVITYPQAVEKVHRAFLEAGVDVIETCTFRSNRITLTEYKLAERTREINLAAARLARKVADEYSTTDQPRFVAGSMGPSGKLPSMNDPELSNVSFDELADVFREQAEGLIEGGVDLLLIETSQDILEVKAAIHGIQIAFERSGKMLPIQAQVTLDTTGRMLLGTDISAVQTILDKLPISVLGLNCSTGPDFMREPIRFLGENCPLPVSCIPNAGLPLNVDGQAVYPLQPEPFAQTLTEFVENYGVRVVGGCCGTTPEHLRLLVNHLKDLKPRSSTKERKPWLASAIQAQAMQQVPPPFFIAERLNTQGSRNFKKMVLENDFESILNLAQQQMDSGAHALDLCVALTERADEPATMRRLIKTISPVINLPLVIDTTELEVLEIALKTAPGRCLINSTHLEGGREKADRIFRLAKQFNAAVIVLTIDENGMAKTAERKLEIARRIYEIAVDEHGLAPEDLVFDDLTFTLATGSEEFARSAIETINGIRLIKQALPGVLTSLGVSNVSFGLAANARGIINSVMLYHCVQAGLDMAIVNPATITPYADISPLERELAEDLIFDRKPEALQRLIEYFNQAAPGENKKDAQQEALEQLSTAQRLHWKIVHRSKENIETDIDLLLSERKQDSQNDRALFILNNVLLPAMKEVGDKFGNGELILPFVLQSAEVMKKAVAYLENFLERKEGASKGKLVLATVYGDVHDIGKNLVKTILSNNGYTVVDLGKQVPAETIINRAIEEKADAIGLSALLVSTSKQMPLIVNELHRRKLGFPVLIGGAAINERFGRRILRTEDGTLFEPGVFYCKDAFEGLSTMDTLISPANKNVLLERIKRESDLEYSLQNPISINKSVNPHRRSAVLPANQIPQVPGWGVRVVHQMPLEVVFEHLSKNDLFRLSWGAKNAHGEEWVELKARFEKRLVEMRKQAIHEKWLNPQGVYGYWPAQSDGQELIIFDPDSLDGKPRELKRFSFPRQPEGDFLCLADYFASIDSGIMDVVALQVVTVGQAATSRFDELQAAGNYTEAYFSHGLAVQTAEATADYLHKHILSELGLPKNQGKRYSWGYPSIPELADHAKVFELLPAHQELGMSLTPAYQLIPEQSTAAIILHHPEARYFTVGTNRLDQLLRE